MLVVNGLADDNLPGHFVWKGQVAYLNLYVLLFLLICISRGSFLTKIEKLNRLKLKFVNFLTHISCKKYLLEQKK